MRLYKFELVIGIVLLIFGVISMIFLILNGGLVSLGIIIPIAFLAIGAYITYLAFVEPKLEEGEKS